MDDETTEGGRRRHDVGRRDQRTEDGGRKAAKAERLKIKTLKG